MDVSAFPYGVIPAKEVVLGAIAQGIWTNGFKYAQDRAIQVSKPINATAPNLFDRITRTENFSLATGQSFKTPGEALFFMGNFPKTVPSLANLRFQQGDQTIWLKYCGITRVELISKESALVIFGFTIVGGTWSNS